MRQHKTTNSVKRTSVKQLILSITTLPLLFACIMITFFASWTFEQGMKNQVLLGLQSSATGALLSLDNLSRDSFHVVDGDLYKGDFNVSQNMDGLDYYAESNSVEITLFYGDKAKVTTIRDKSGNRLIDATADPSITEAVLKKGEPCSSSNVMINDKPYYGYYMPVNDTEQKIIGMVFAGRERDSVFSYILSRILFIVLIALLNYAACFAVAMNVSKKKFVGPLQKLTTAARELAKGNINQKLEKASNDEFGDLTDSFIALMDNISDQAYIAGKMSDGDLTVSLEPASDQDVLGIAIRQMIHDNNQNLTTIRNATDRMVSGVQGIVSASNSLAQGTTEQAGAIEQITASINGIADSANVNAGNASHADELVKKTRDQAVQSNEQIRQMTYAMQDINDASENISKIMKLINDIASQTNIISLNASVEAARAGAHGKGFSVVAEEIRELASKSTQAAKDSAELIQNSIEKTAIGTQLASDVAISLEEIMTLIETMTSLISEIAETSANQSTSVNQVNIGISQISDVVQVNSATSEECAAASTTLLELATQLRGAVEQYRLQN